MRTPAYRPSGLSAEITPEDVRGHVFSAQGRIALSRLVMQCWLQPRTQIRGYAAELASAATALAAHPAQAAKAALAGAAAEALFVEADRREALRGNARDKDDEMRAGALLAREWAAAEMKIVHDFSRRIAASPARLPSFEEAARLYEVFPRKKGPSGPAPWEQKRPRAVIPSHVTIRPQLTLSEAIAELNGKPTNADARLARLRLGGKDRVSDMSQAELEADLGPEATEAIKNALRVAARRIPEPSLITAAQRWALRGLRPRLAARKAWLDHKTFGK